LTVGHVVVDPSFDQLEQSTNVDDVPERHR
jgi:hypothetical protein